MGRGNNNTNTNGAINAQSTEIIDTSSARAGRPRMSFLKRLQNPPPPPFKEQEAVLAPVVNGNAVKSISGSIKKKTNGVKNIQGTKKAKSGNGEEESERSRSKENRKSFFSSGDLGSIGRGRGRDAKMSEKEEESEWITQSDLSSAVGGGKGGADAYYSGRRSSSSARPKTGGSQAQSTLSLKRDGSVGRGESASTSAMGSVRKRFSMLKLGKKSSKASVLVDSVAEED
jgi:dedicator of cytokinesis protein 3